MRLKFFCFIALILLSSCKQAPIPANYKVINATINEGDTLSGNLEDAGLSNNLIPQITMSLSKVFNPRRCRPGDYYEAVFDETGNFVRFNYYLGAPEYYSVEMSSSGILVPYVKVEPYKTNCNSGGGTITSTLWDAMVSKGIKPELISDFTDKFAWQIDFLTETRVGDSFKVVYESFVSNDGKRSFGKDRILGAQYIANGKTYTAVLYPDNKNQDNYYTPKGESLRRAFLKAPLQFARISSYFSKKRFHPILRYFRPHLGIDYAAPRGTPVSAVADGLVTFAGWKNGFGRYLIIRHANGYVSYYGHLHGFAKGIRAGKHVNQGQVVAYVGSTGMSTGPHLDFRFTANGKFINFLSLKFPPSRAIPVNVMPDFKEKTKGYLVKLAEIRVNS